VTMEQEALKMVEALHSQPSAQIDTGRFDPRPAKN
jgi:hypothetical protein